MEPSQRVNTLYVYGEMTTPSAARRRIASGAPCRPHQEYKGKHAGVCPC